MDEVEVILWMNGVMYVNVKGKKLEVLISFKSSVENFFMTDIISRIFVIMVKCIEV